MQDPHELLMQLHAAHSAHSRACTRMREAAAALPDVPVLLGALLEPTETMQLQFPDRESVNVFTSTVDLLAPALTFALTGSYQEWARKPHLPESVLTCEGVHLNAPAPSHRAGGARASIVDANRDSTNEWALARTPLWATVMRWWDCYAQAKGSTSTFYEIQSSVALWENAQANVIADSVMRRTGRRPTAIVRQPPPTARDIVAPSASAGRYDGPPLAQFPHTLGGWRVQADVDAARAISLTGHELLLASRVFEVADARMKCKMPAMFQEIRAAQVLVTGEGQPLL